MRRLLFLATLAAVGLFGLLLLAGCGQTETLSGVRLSAATITPNGDGRDDVVTIYYAIGRRSKVKIYLEDSQGKRYTLRDAAPRMPTGESYSMRFDGTVKSDQPPVLQRVLPNGDYTVVVEATPEAGGPAITQSAKVSVRDAATKLPLVDGLKVFPATVTPNGDAIDDVATFSYRLPITATVSINITNGRDSVPFITDLEEGPYEQSHIWNAKKPDESLLPTGVYTYTVRAADRVGNIVQRSGQLRIEKSGQAEARITYIDIAPIAVAISNTITVTMKIKNTGDVKIRTQGPPSGYRYNTNLPFSAVENQRWAEKGGGFWRAGLDWGGGRAYPFRWALTPRPPEKWQEPGVWDYFLPGEEVTITGTVQILQREDKMYFYGGLIHEGVGYPEDRKGETLVKVGF